MDCLFVHLLTLFGDANDPNAVSESSLQYAHIVRDPVFCAEIEPQLGEEQVGDSKAVACAKHEGGGVVKVCVAGAGVEPETVESRHQAYTVGDHTHSHYRRSKICKLGRGQLRFCSWQIMRSSVRGTHKEAVQRTALGAHERARCPLC